MNDIYSLIRPYYFKDYAKHDRSVILPFTLTIIVSIIDSFTSLWFTRICAHIDCVINVEIMITIVNVFVLLVDLYSIKISFADKKIKHSNASVIFVETFSSLVLATECFAFLSLAIENDLEMYFPLLLVLCNLIRLLRGKGCFTFLNIAILETYIFLPFMIFYFNSDYPIFESFKESLPVLVKNMPLIGEYLLKIIYLQGDLL